MLLTELSCHQLCNVHRDLIRNSQAIATNCKTVHRHRCCIEAACFPHSRSPSWHNKQKKTTTSHEGWTTCLSHESTCQLSHFTSATYTQYTRLCKRLGKSTAVSTLQKHAKQLKQKCSQQTHSLKSYNWKRRTCPVAKATARSSCTSHVTPLNPKAGC